MPDDRTPNRIRPALLNVDAVKDMPFTPGASPYHREGDVNMYQIAKTLHNAGYPYMLMPDHAPHHPDDVAPEGVSKRVRQAWAFQFGYIIALIQALENESSQ